MASLLRRLSLRKPVALSPDKVVLACQTAANALVAIQESPAPTKLINELEKSLDELHLLLFSTPYSPKGGCDGKTPLLSTPTPTSTSISTTKSEASSGSTKTSDISPTTLSTSTSTTNTNTNTTTTTTTNSTATITLTKSEAEPTTISTTVLSLIIQEEIDLFFSLVLIIPHLTFEHRKLVAILFNYFYRTYETFRDYIITKTIILDFLVSGYDIKQRDICINCHHILYECIKKDKRIVSWLLSSQHLSSFLNIYCLSNDFELQAKAFTIFSSMLSLKKKTSATFIKANSDVFFDL
jgi:hypothetical protein